MNPKNEKLLDERGGMEVAELLDELRLQAQMAVDFVN